jgi:plasmid stability protein
MPTLYVENVPKDLYQALRKRARDHRKSIAAEVISLLERNVPTAGQLRRRRELYERLAELRKEESFTADHVSARGARGGKAEPRFPAVEDLIREDRDR